MRLRPIVLLVVLALVGGLSGCVMQRSTSTREIRSGYPMMSMTFSESSYLAEMVPHHLEAIRAAQELARSQRPEMRRLGEDIVRSQSAQVDQMRGWLATWWTDTGEDTAYRPMMRDLTGLGGDALDRAFLDDMVRHHMMAVMMSQQILRTRGATHQEVTDLARRISADQSAEIDQMRTWQRAWFGERGSMMSGW
ncbi:hypothetical protein GCM10022415_32970 [Knoellia locipacati]|uniref:DUF305 domain-containing protein n=1 Tax=Knoellia locipacati TaxID=882824 RepID=A0A512T507_9MICO|nr:DUF305 domain-containing protein [Knoellia locipacati]GEQ15289.1 hypothetical protein KLO01_33360 [Knoellia locipacati]